MGLSPPPFLGLSPSQKIDFNVTIAISEHAERSQGSCFFKSGAKCFSWDCFYHPKWHVPPASHSSISSKYPLKAEEPCPCLQNAQRESHWVCRTLPISSGAGGEASYNVLQGSFLPWQGLRRPQRGLEEEAFHPIPSLPGLLPSSPFIVRKCTSSSSLVLPCPIFWRVPKGETSLNSLSASSQG